MLAIYNPEFLSMPISIQKGVKQSCISDPFILNFYIINFYTQNVDQTLKINPFYPPKWPINPS